MGCFTILHQGLTPRRARAVSVGSSAISRRLPAPRDTAAPPHTHPLCDPLRPSNVLCIQQLISVCGPERPPRQGLPSGPHLDQATWRVGHLSEGDLPPWTLRGCVCVDEQKESERQAASLRHMRQLGVGDADLLQPGHGPWRRWGAGCPEPQAVLAWSPSALRYFDCLLREAYQPGPAPPASQASSASPPHQLPASAF